MRARFPRKAGTFFAHQSVFTNQLVALFGHIGTRGDGLVRKDDFVRKVAVPEHDIGGVRRSGA